jgi:hypothetical protein
MGEGEVINMMNKISEEMCAIIPWNDPSPVAYINVFELGDIWVKTKSCDGCSQESKEMCCHNCPVFTGDGCMFHQSGKYSTNKPFECVVKPTPEQGRSYCQLEFTCISGKYKGKVRRLKETLDELEK